MIENGVLFSKDWTKLYAYPMGKTEDIYKFSNIVKEIENRAFVSCIVLI